MLKDIIIKNRSYRGFDESCRISREQLTEYVNLTRYTASSVNAQPLKYHIVCEKEEVELVQGMTKWARALPQMTLPHPGMCPTGFIIIMQDTKLASNLNRFLKDVGIVAQTMLLAATEKGLGGCMIGNFTPDQVKEALNLPENLVPMLIVAFGEPAETIVLKEIDEGESIRYYRDENDVHYVPKRKQEDIIITR